MPNELPDRFTVRALLKESGNRHVPVKPDMPIFQMSHPKTGTMLLRNIVLHYVGHDQTHLPLIFNLEQTEEAAKDETKSLFYGHLPYSPEALEYLHGWKKVLLMRSPAYTVVALARACLDPRSERPDQVHLREKGVSVLDIIPMIIDGYDIEGVRQGPFRDSYRDFVQGWQAHADVTVQYDELAALSLEIAEGRGESEARAFLTSVGLSTPDDWRERWLAGADRGQSITYLPPADEQLQERYTALATQLLKL